MATKPKTASKHFWDLTPQEREEAITEFDQPLSPGRMKPLSKRGRLLWERAQKAGSGKSKGNGTKTITVELDQQLLKKSDEYAQARGITRDELINRSLRSALTFVQGD
jgi:hypothetical protein